MAAPTITTIVPAYGHPGGKELVTVEGTGFALPASPPASGYVGGDSAATMQVEVGGRLATDVRVFSATLLTFLSPAYRGNPSLLSSSPGLLVDVVVRNIGPPVEETTYEDAFAYRRTDLTRTDGPIKHVVRTIIRELRRQVIDYTVTGTVVDFDGSPDDSLDIVELAQIPALALFGPTITEDKYRRSSEIQSSQNLVSYSYTKTRIPRTCTLGFTATLTARGAGEIQHLIQELMDFFVRNPRLTVQSDPDDDDSDEIELDLFLTDGPSRTGTANDSSVYSATATFEVKGLDIDADSGTRIEWGRVVEDPDESIVLSVEEHRDED